MSDSRPSSDALVDSLLVETARRGADPDEEFLRSLEDKIDELETRSAGVTRVSFVRLTSYVLAASVVVGAMVFFLNRTQERETSEAPPIAEETNRSPEDLEKYPVEADGTGSGEGRVPSIATSYMIRNQERVKKADEAAHRGSTLLAEGDLQGTLDQYRAALDLLPEAPITEPRRRAYVKQFSRASVLLATQRAEEGRYPESIALIEDVLRPSIDPDNIDAKRVLEQLNDPDYYRPVLSPSQLERVRRVKLAVKTVEGYLKQGNVDRADYEFWEALNEDPYNVAARRGQEKNERHRLDYYDQAYNPTRTSFLRQVATGWETPAPEAVDALESSRYGSLNDNAWASPLTAPLSTFSIDVDTASWTNIRGMIRNGISADGIPDGAVRIEELINYFDWDYPQPEGEHPFAFSVETATSHWNDEHKIMRVGIQGRDMRPEKRPDANLVFLLDVSRSMNHPNKLQLVRHTLAVLVDELQAQDRVSIVVYAGAEGLALDTVAGSDTESILATMYRLSAGGPTNGGAGIELAYRKAREQFIEGGVNRVILCTDGDFNVGLTGTEALVDLVKKEAESGVFLSVCGFGNDNLNDAMLEELTNKGNGNYFFIDSLREGRKVFLRDLMSTLVTIAKDVKIQIEFNPAKVKSYRLIGYANRMLKEEDFTNDEVDAGEVGAGHTVTALYEIIPADGAPKVPEVTELRYQKPTKPSDPEMELIDSSELALLKLRYKKPDGDVSIPMEQPILEDSKRWEERSDDYRFAVAVSLFGMILRENESVESLELRDAAEMARQAIGQDRYGDRTEFVDLLHQLMKAEE